MNALLFCVGVCGSSSVGMGVHVHRMCVSSSVGLGVHVHRMCGSVCWPSGAFLRTDLT